MDLPTLRALTTPEGRVLLDRVRHEYDGSNALATSARLRRDHAPEVVAAAITQVDLRRRAVGKLGPDAERMWFTADALEQSTRRPVADHRTARLRERGVRSVLDLGCGIGGDLVAMAAAGLAVTGVERDPLRAELARTNLAELGLPGRVVVGDAESVARGGHDVVFADPVRRIGSRRVFDPAAYTPSWTFVTELLASDAVVKVAPGLGHELVPAGVEAEWVSDGGDLKEAALWSGRLAGASRRATLLPSGVTVTETDDPGAAPVLPPQRFVYEPDPAVIRAGLVTAVAAVVGGGLLDRRIAYLTADREVPTPLARGYRVREQLPYREKALRAALRTRGVGRLEIKKRGVDVTPEVLRKRLSLRGESAATIIVTRVDGRATVLLVDPLPRT